MIIDAFVAVCLLATPVPECNQRTAVAWMSVPSEHDLRLPMQCMRAGMLYAAESQLVTRGSYLKVLCVRPQPEKVPENAS
jgi:hypothetical protein